jgi:hypothetical protein
LLTGTTPTKAGKFSNERKNMADQPSGGGAGYDVSASRAESAAAALNAASPTVINFGAGAYVDGGWYGQTATPSSSAKASRDSKDVAGDTGGAQPGLLSPEGGINFKSPVVIAVAIAAVALAVYAMKKG